MPEMHQPSSDPTEPDAVEETPPPIEEGDEELTEVAGGGEITDIGEDAPSS